MELAYLDSLKNPQRFIIGKCCDHSSDFIFEVIIFILADKKDNYKSLDEFEFH